MYVVAALNQASAGRLRIFILRKVAHTGGLGGTVRIEALLPLSLAFSFRGGVVISMLRVLYIYILGVDDSLSTA